MERLVIIRHGEYSSDDHLSKEGQEQISQLGNKLKATVDGQHILILTSVADRARESAEILGKIFSAEIEEHDVLWSESCHPENLSKALELIRSRKESTDVLILVTHLEYAERLPFYFGEKELDTQLYHQEIGKGEALDIDCEEKTITCIR